jgi:hypothetical protein
VTDPIAEELRIPVRLVLHPREPRAPQLGLEGRPTELDERADDRSAHRRDSGQAAHTGALHEPHQYGLGLIVGGVTERDALGAYPGRVRLERRKSRRPRRGLERVRPGHRDGRDVDGNAETRPESPNEFGVGGRLRPQLVVDVKNVEPQAPFRGQARQEVEQRHGIGAARDGD